VVIAVWNFKRRISGWQGGCWSDATFVDVGHCEQGSGVASLCCTPCDATCVMPLLPVFLFGHQGERLSSRSCFQSNACLCASCPLAYGMPNERGTGYLENCFLSQPAPMAHVEPGNLSACDRDLQLPRWQHQRQQSREYYYYNGTPNRDATNVLA
jgi:hypothetical protein